MTNNNNSNGNTNIKTIALMTTIIIALTTFAYAIYNNKLDTDIYELQKSQTQQRFDKIDNSLDKIFNYMITNKKDK